MIIGIAQGLVAGLGYYLFGINNALLLTVITTIVGIIPVIGPIITGAIMFAFTGLDSWTKATFITIVFFLIHSPA